MACSNNQTNNTLGNLGLDENYICCCNDRFTFNLDPIGDGRYTLTCTPCSLPTAVFDVATISVRQNSCNQIEYYQAAINTDPLTYLVLGVLYSQNPRLQFRFLHILPICK